MEQMNNSKLQAEVVRAQSGIELLPHQVLEFESRIIKHDGYTSAMEAIKNIHARYRPPESEAKFKARCLLIVGESGAGKTTALESYSEQFPAITLEDLEFDRPEALALPEKIKAALQDASLRRVMLIEVPKRATQRSLVAAILGAYGYKVHDHWNTDDIVRKIIFLVRETKTELIMLDEGHQLVNQSNVDAMNDVLEFIKSLLNRIGVSIVIAGIPKLLTVTKEIKDQQFKRRMVAPVVLSPYKWTTRKGRARFQALMTLFERNLGLSSPSGLANHDTAMRLYVATGGEVGIVSKYLSHALQLALQRQLPSISVELLAEVHAGLEAEVTPYDEDIEFDDIIDEDSTSIAVHNSANNPFLCPKQNLRDLWLRRQGRDASLTKGQSTPTAVVRKTTLRGRGRRHHTPLDRAS